MRHLFPSDSASPLTIDSTAVLVPVYLRLKFPSVIVAGLVYESHSPTSTPGSKACESDTQEEHIFGYPLGATLENSMENVNFGVEEVESGGLLRGPGLHRMPTSVAVDVITRVRSISR